MIASERSQNIIVVTTIIVALISVGMIVSNSQYYGGTYALAGRLDVSLVGIRVSNIDYTNESINPVIRISFNFYTDSESEGNVRLRFIRADLTLNNDSLSLGAYAHTLPDAEQVLYPGYNKTFNLHSEITGSDKTTVLDAYNSSTWNWDINCDYYFIVFDERGTITWRYLDFETTETTIVL
jgi:hypothetical protein